LAAWTELHQRVAELPDKERTVFELHYYLGLPQAQIASELGLAPKQVSRLWMSARERLADQLEEAGSLF
jgi:RNA polymerase sigma factor (sigma-70 family)